MSKTTQIYNLLKSRATWVDSGEIARECVTCCASTHVSRLARSWELSVRCEFIERRKKAGAKTYEYRIRRAG